MTGYIIGNYSLRSIISQVAEEFKDEPRIYFPHSLDFRGRAYPMHPHLNHMGQDICRGLLTFADARPLGRHGLGWLYVQVSSRCVLGCRTPAWVLTRSFRGRPCLELPRFGQIVHGLNLCILGLEFGMTLEFGMATIDDSGPYTCRDQISMLGAA